MDSPPENVYSSNVDTSRPFRSVKEAVAIFGERFLAPEIYSQKQPFSFPMNESPLFQPSPVKSPDTEPCWIKGSSMSPSPMNSCYSIQDTAIMETVKKLETELEETKAELKLLKERESDTEIALASLNAELHKNMSKLAQAEAAVAAKAAARGGDTDGISSAVVIREEEKKRDDIFTSSSSLAQILSTGEKESLFVGKKKERKLTMMKKKKPIVPLVGDLFSGRKKGSTSVHNPLFGSSYLQLN